MANLDDIYGRPTKPLAAVTESEQRYQPRSLNSLDAASAASLKAYMDSHLVTRLSSVVHETSPILWVMNEAGAIMFAHEEVVEKTSGKLRYLLPHSYVKMQAGEEKLGHPAVLGYRDGYVTARIAGEITFDPGHEDGPWVISNRSGRFGIRRGIGEAQLRNVAKLFSAYQIRLGVYHITPREQV
nr:hypothetical protein [uncultured Gellertiella sp.]